MAKASSASQRAQRIDRLSSEVSIQRLHQEEKNDTHHSIAFALNRHKPGSGPAGTTIHPE